MTTHDFKPGDRLKSKQSGIVYIYALENPVAPPGFVPVRGELWAEPTVLYLRPENLELVDEDYPDAAKNGV